MTEGKRGPGRPRKSQPDQKAGHSAGQPGDAEQTASGKAAEPQQADPRVERSPDEITVRVAKRYERGGLVVPVGTVFAVRDTREVRRQLKHRCLEQVE